MARVARLPANDSAPRRDRAPLRKSRRAKLKYHAFLSYSHKDEALADWLHQELEAFRVPPSLVGRMAENGPIPKRLTPIFRDQHELAAAHDLGDEIEAALASTQFLIVLCSPAAANSHWTNAEIVTFKRSRPDGCILAVIAAGEPFASEVPGREDEECFPPALRQKYDRRGRPTGKRAEPLAADLRDSGDGRRMGFLKLVAGMLGVGLDELVQRETTQRHRRLAWLTAASLAGMAVTSSLAITAIQARDSARDQRREAEGLVAFMLGDLKDKLEPIGKLDALDGVGSKVLDYYSKQDASELSDAGLVQRARALGLMAQVAYLRGKMSGALRLYREAMAGTEEAVRRDPDNPQRLFDHAQHVFWVASIAGEQGNLKQAESGYREYKRLALQMVALQPDNMKWRMEEQYADANLGIILYQQRRFVEAGKQFNQALGTVQALATADSRNAEYQKSSVMTLAWLADARMSEGRLEEATALRQRQLALLEQLSASSGGDVAYKAMQIPAQQALARLLAFRGQRAEAIEHLRQGIAVAQELIALEQDNTVWLESGYGARLLLAENALHLGQGGEAAAQTASACQTVRGLIARDARFPQWRAGLRECELMRARLALASGDVASARTAALKAVAAAKTVRSSDSSTDRFATAKAYRLLGDIERESGNGEAAKQAWANAMSILPSGIQERPGELAERETILQRTGRTEQAQLLARRLDAIGVRRES